MLAFNGLSGKTKALDKALANRFVYLLQILVNERLKSDLNHLIER